MLFAFMIESRPHILFFRETDRNTRSASHSIKARRKLRATYKMVKSSAYHITSEMHVRHAFSTEKAFILGFLQGMIQAILLLFPASRICPLLNICSRR